ncbi:MULTISPECIES: hypothetical protein [unclassified Streptomyces]|uniref:Uncharacterized protein n=1 Tax=Streptomyces sp. R33 TaxID=3238629 RepID=A0AB39XZR7_9ACTN|nr:MULTISPECIES: hypothetical protein [unclassified Streptomyces]KOY54912.1 hypothetical protein ADK59_27925 [Streptomyces sp. XY332]TDU74111.1 hypothetical protein EDD91_0745 [Streptomyces sp. KS 21]THA32064.1 hypothetical protein E6W17_34495 [Streptomyces sp. A1547]
MAYRYLVAGLGLALMGLGGALLIQQPSPWRIALWLAGAVVVHDGLIAPLVIAVAVLTGAFGLRLRGVPRAALIVAGSLTAIALPPLLRPGGAANPTVVPLDYVRNWLLTMAAIAVAAGLWAGTRAALRGARRKP